MKTSKCVTLLSLVSALLLLATLAVAGVSRQTAERLNGDLTPLGAERAGNREGSIPAWSGGMSQPPSGTNVTPGDFLPDPFKGDKVAFSITTENMEQYANRLTEGTRWLLKQYPDTFRLDIYPTRRPQAAPQWVYDNTFQNALHASSTAWVCATPVGTCTGATYRSGRAAFYTIL